MHVVDFRFCILLYYRIILFLRQATEQQSTCSQFLAHALRQLISRPHALQGLLGRCCLLPLNADFIQDSSFGFFFGLCNG